MIALNLGLACSWLASATASSHAASRLVYSMGVERLLPAAVHRRAPPVPHPVPGAAGDRGGGALGAAQSPSLGGSRRPRSAAAESCVRWSWRRTCWSRWRRCGSCCRIREQTPGRAAGAAWWPALAGVALLGVPARRDRGSTADLAGARRDRRAAVGRAGVAAAACAGGDPRDAAPRWACSTRAESVDVLPGAGVFAPDAAGNAGARRQTAGPADRTRGSADGGPSPAMAESPAATNPGRCRRRSCCSRRSPSSAPGATAQGHLAAQRHPAGHRVPAAEPARGRRLPGADRRPVRLRARPAHPRAGRGRCGGRRPRDFRPAHAVVEELRARVRFGIFVVSYADDRVAARRPRPRPRADQRERDPHATCTRPPSASCCSPSARSWPPRRCAR